MKSRIAALVVALAGAVQAGQIDIIGFDTSEGMKFEGGTISNFFNLEFAQHPDGPWTNWGSVSAQPITGTVMSLPSPFFFRVVEAQSNAFPPYATGTPVYVESDPAYLADKPNIATGTPLYVETDSVAMSAGFLTTETDPVATAALADYETKTGAAAAYQPIGDYATGMPVYVESDPQYQTEKSMYATGTPVYAESDPVAMSAGFLTTETDPVASAALADYETETHAATTYQPIGTYATGTPVYAETDPKFSQYFQTDTNTGHVGFRTVSTTSSFAIASTVKSTTLSGSVSIFNNSDQLAGGSTLFQNELVPNEVVVIGNVFTSRVKSIASQTALTLTTTNKSGDQFGVSLRRLNDQNIIESATTLNSNYFKVDSLGNIKASGYVEAKGGVQFQNGLMTHKASFGDWEKNIVIGSNYQAATDGFVIWVNCQRGGWSSVYYVFAGNTNPPTTLRGIANPGSEYDAQTITIPVKRGWYWRLEKSGDGPGIPYWMPL